MPQLHHLFKCLLCRDFVLPLFVEKHFPTSTIQMYYKFEIMIIKSEISIDHLNTY